MSLFKSKAFIFDIDGTLADNTHRHHLIAKAPKEWGKYFNLAWKDKPYWDVIEIAQELEEKYNVFFLSGRTDEGIHRSITVSWLVGVGFTLVDERLYMRRANDYREDSIIKWELYERHIQPKYNVLGVFDDRQRVVDMWRSHGLRCYQVQPGDF